MQLAHAFFLGILEGLTEFLPISSTGHLILAVDMLALSVPPDRVFEVVIQFGAILAICVLYFVKLWQVLRDALMGDAAAWRFIRNIALAFFPAVVIGILARDLIMATLFNPTVVALALISGGVIILLIERLRPLPTIHDTESMGWRVALMIGFVQCLAMIPGVSRSGATIMGARFIGMERRAAAEFSFFLAIPTMLGAASFQLYKTKAALSASDMEMIATGFLAAFFAALFVVRWALGFISKHGFAPFAYYRIALGSVILALLYI
ncbi:MAG: undecaprenyl-diphosphate phosphatase [Alphaproteobacteria bacterium]|nr:undecaprenyl-diphosphate phosphatase [Alphaproteobacteria bacterium]